MQRLKLDINPKGEIPVLYVSQYDKGRLFEVELVEGDQAYNLPLEYSVQLNVRKTDSKLVTAAPETIVDNILTFATTEQMTACAGENIGSVTLKDADDIVITTLYFLISVQRDVLSGGLSSQSEIHNLEEQIASIVPEVIGDYYYNKTETNALLSNKANVSDLATLASKAELEYAIVEEDAAVKDWVSSHFATPGYVADRYYNKNQVDALIDNIFPTLSASGAIASFKTALNKPLVSVTHEAGATTITRCGKNFVALNGSPYHSAVNTGVSVNSESTDLLSITSSAVAYACRQLYYKLPAGTYTVSLGETTKTGTDTPVISIYDYSNGTLIVNALSANNNVVFTLSDETVLDIRLFATGTTAEVNTVTFSDFQIELGSTATAYEPYNGQTVPVADATSLATLSGVNNVFADEGDVTVQYKYMSI